MLKLKKKSLIIIALVATFFLGCFSYLLLNENFIKYFSPDKNIAFKVDYEKQEKVYTNSDLVLSFDVDMKRKSVEENLILPKNISGSIAWKDDKTLIFSPNHNLKIDKVYTFKIGEKVVSLEGGKFNSELNFDFIIVDYPVLNTHFPKTDELGVPIDAQITLIFDRPVVSLTSIKDKSSPDNWGVEIFPKIDGQWKWVGTTSVKFVPKKNLAAATKYEVKVPSGILFASGEKTVEDFSFGFTTVRPKIVSTIPRMDESDIEPDSKIILNFNLEIDLEDARTKINMFAMRKHEQNEKQKQIDISYTKQEKEGDAVEDKSSITISPLEKLVINSTKYRIKVDKNIHSNIDDLGSESGFVLNFKTAGPFFVKEGTFEYGINIKFSNPIEDDMSIEKIKISPTVEGWDSLDLSRSSWNRNYLRIVPTLKPSTTYNLTIKQNFKDKWGQSLPEDYHLKFTTDPVPSKVFIHSDGRFGIFERDKAPIYYLNSVNAKRLNISMAKLELPQFLEIRKNINSNYDFEPELNKYSFFQQWNINPKNKKDTWESMAFNLGKKVNKDLTSGIYILSLSSPDYVSTWGDKSQIFDYQYFVLTNIGLTLKYSGNQALVWATDLLTGKMLNNAFIEFYSLKGDKIISGYTDENGFFETKLDIKKFVSHNNTYNPEFYVTAKYEDDFAFIGSRWDSGIAPYNFGLRSDFHGAQEKEYDLETFIYSERPIYRPGDTVNFKGIVRLRDSDGILYPPKMNRRAFVKIVDSKNNEVYNKNLNFTKFGSFTGSLSLSEASALGNYYLEMNIDPNTDVSRNYNRMNFSVLAYRKPEYKVDLSFTKEDFFNGENIDLEVNGSYYFGAPLDNAKLKWRAKTTDYFYNKNKDGWYSFALENSWCWWNCDRRSSLLTSGSGSLDEKGNAKINFPINIDDKDLGQVITLEVDITDANNQVVSSRISVPVHKSKVYVGIYSESYVVKPGEEAIMNIITLDPQGNSISGQEVLVKLFSRTWNTIRKKSVDGRYYYENEAKDEFISDTEVETGKDGKVKAKIKVPSGGQYRVVAHVKDSDSLTNKAGTSVYSWSSAYVNWPHKNDSKIDIVADKPEYAVGESAKLLIKSPYQGTGVKALVTVERENIFTKKVIDIKSNAQSIEIPITEDLIPNAYVSVIILKPRIGETFNDNGLDTGAPAFKIGYKKILVETKLKKLNLSIETDKKKYRPGEIVHVKLKAKDYYDKPVNGEFSLGVVDMSVLELTGFQMPDLVKRFYSERGLGIITSELLTYLIERFKPGSKGGGGADPSTKKRGDFRDTAYWNPIINTDENGEATLEFKLPDNLTTWKLLAIASTKKSDFGAVAEEIIETKKVILRPVRPRFAVVGDEIELGAIVHNYLDEDREFTVSLKGTGFTLNGKNEREVSIKSNEKVKINFGIKVGMGEKLTLSLIAKSKDALDEIEETIPVYLFGTPQSVATSGLTEDTITEKILVPSEDNVSAGNLDISISPTLATYLPKGLEYLVKFPYGCAEQTISKLLPNVAVNSLQGFDVFNFVSDDVLDKNITTGMERLYSFQRIDGGFGYWNGSRKSFPYLSAYILYAFNKISESGYFVDTKVKNDLQSYLNSVLRSQDLYDDIDLTTRAYILYVLAESGDLNLSLLNNIYEIRDNLPLFAKGYLAMSYKEINQAESLQKAKKIVNEILSNVKVDPRGAFFTEETLNKYKVLMNTNDRTTAIVLQALIQIDPNNEIIPKIVRRLMTIRTNGHWDTTQSTSLSILALVDFLKSTNELEADMKVTVDLNGKELLSSKFNKENILSKQEFKILLSDLMQDKESDVAISKKGDGRVYYDLLFSYFYTSEFLDPEEEGFGIVRDMYKLDDKKFQNPLYESQIGETYKIKLTITVPQNRYLVAVNSPLPTGMEIIDISLNTSQKSLLEDEVNRCNERWTYDCVRSNNWRFNHKEFRDDALFMFADYLPAGIYEYEYLVRATTPGKFKYRPARVWEMYFPENFGQTEGGWFSIEED